MRRHLAGLAAWLLLSAAITAAVAWGCASWSVERFTRLRAAPGDADAGVAIITSLGDDPTDERAWAFRSAGVGVQWTDVSMGASTALVTLVRSGWPVPAFAGGGGATNTPPATGYAWAIVYDALVGAHFSRPYRTMGAAGTLGRLIPLRPMWPGFAIDVLFYAALLWLCRRGFLALRRLRRRLRRQCQDCAYPIGHALVCTECGRALAARPRRRALRWAMGAGAALLTGAAINIAVAWGCALWSANAPPAGIDPGRVDPDLEWWTRHAPTQIEYAPPGDAQEMRLGPGKVRMTMWARWGPLMVRDRAGWPMLALEADWWDDRDRTFASESWRASLLLPRIFPGQKDVVAPLGPVMPGFLVNTLAFAIPVFLAGCAVDLRRARAPAIHRGPVR